MFVKVFSIYKCKTNEMSTNLKHFGIMRAKVYSSREIVRILNANNYFAISRKGSHIKYYNAETKVSFVLTTDKGVNPMIWRRIVKTYNIILTI